MILSSVRFELLFHNMHHVLIRELVLEADLLSSRMLCTRSPHYRTVERAR